LDENESNKGAFVLFEKHMFLLPLKTTDNQLTTQLTGSVG